mmetsp:Transcript_14919/g.30042  ORF Transcript_14919/g.30042 Transcript_14919/m.30042 type:complete len:349 (+) Transcript_14919:2189-3235(+)
MEQRTSMELEQELPLTATSNHEESLAENADHEGPQSPTRNSQLQQPHAPNFLPVSSSSTIHSRLFSLANFLLTTNEGIRISSTLIVSVIVLYFVHASISVFASGKESGAQPYDFNAHRILAKRVITIFGVESSGTTFLYQTLSKATNASVVIPDLAARAGDEVEIQHISQPWGMYGYSTGGYSTIDVVPPLGCASFFDKRVESVASEKCKEETGLDPGREYPLRFFVNITSHVEWYRTMGVDCTAIIMTRDYSAHLEGKRKHIIRPFLWKRVATAEDKYGTELLVEAMNALDGSVSPGGLKQLVMVSYETLMFLKADYLRNIYRQLGIDSTYIPTFHDGNAKHFRGGK